MGKSNAMKKVTPIQGRNRARKAREMFDVARIDYGKGIDIDVPTHVKLIEEQNIVASKSVISVDPDYSTENADMGTTEDTKLIGLTSEQELVLERFSTKSAKIRYLHSIGCGRSQIAKKVGVIYQHVRNVLTTPLKRPIKDKDNVGTITV